MEGEVFGEEALLQKLRDSRRRFQRHMQELLEKYNQPFEDGPVIQMSTLTYKTPQGLRVWGGGLVKMKNEDRIQGSLVNTASSKGGSTDASSEDDEPPSPCAPDLGLDSESSDIEATFCREDLTAKALTLAVPGSPLKDELRRKYLTQVDRLLQDEGFLEDSDDGDGNDTHVSLVPALDSPPRPARGHCGRVSADRACEPSASSPRDSTEVAVVPRRDRVLWQETSVNSASSSQSFVADDICSVTISDLYEGMLHSMCRLLSTKPSGIISTKTFIVRKWDSWRRRRGKSGLNRTDCRGSRPARGRCSRPAKDGAVLRECQNLPEPSGQKAGLAPGKAFLGVSKLQIWRELKGTAQKSSWPCVDFCATQRLGQENRLMTLRWLISPVKMASRPGGPHSEGRFRARGSRFERLHQEYCLSPRQPPHLASLPCSVSGDHGHRGGAASPRCLQGFETHQPSRSFSRAKSLNETFEILAKRAAEAGKCLPENGSPCLTKTEAAWSRGCSEPAAGLVPGHHLGIFGKSVSLSKAVSVARVQPLGFARDRHSEIRERFDRLHWEYCRRSPQRTRTRASLGAGSVPG